MEDREAGRERPGGAERPQGSGAAASGGGGRMSRHRKTAAVLRRRRGEDLETVSRSLGVTAATLTSWRDACPDAARLATIRTVLADSPFPGKGHREVWARPRLCGVRSSKRRVLRLMRENHLLARSRAGAPRRPRSHDGSIIPDTVDTMWGTDRTTTITGEGQAVVLVAVDHCSAACVGIHADRRATRFQALERIRQRVRPRFGGFAKGLACGLSGRHEHGSQYRSDAFQSELRFLGINRSPALSASPKAAAAPSASSAP